MREFSGPSDKSPEQKDNVEYLEPGQETVEIVKTQIEAAAARGEAIATGKKGRGTRFPSSERIPGTDVPIWELQTSRIFRKDFTAVVINEPRGDSLVNRLSYLFTSSAKDGHTSLAMVQVKVVDADGNLKAFLPQGSRVMTPRDKEDINAFVHGLFDEPEQA